MSGKVILNYDNLNLDGRYPDAIIQGHRDFSPDLNHNGIIEPKEWIRACPSFDAKRVYSMSLARIHRF